jgi:translation elongation factor EF-1beta
LNKKVIYDKILNNINENEPRKNVLNKLKVENINLKVKNGLLKTTIEKKEKIIEALNNKINELENNKNIINNKNRDNNNAQLNKEINS